MKWLNKVLSSLCPGKETTCTSGRHKHMLSLPCSCGTLSMAVHQDPPGGTSEPTGCACRPHCTLWAPWGAPWWVMGVKCCANTLRGTVPSDPRSFMPKDGTADCNMQQSRGQQQNQPLCCPCLNSSPFLLIHHKTSVR